MASPDQRVVEVAAAKAAAQAQQAKKAAGGAALAPSRGSRDLMTALMVGLVLVLTLGLAIYAGR